MDRSPIATHTDPGAQLWLLNREAVTGVRIWGTNLEHHFPVVGFDRIWVGQDPTGPDVRHVLRIDHPSVSRRHATIEWRGGHFVLTDASSFGTWVYMGNQTEPVVLRRTECYLVGHGQIALGCDRHAENAPLVLFSVTG